MLKRRCPFVGLCGDPDTVVAFASMRNCCNRIENPQPIRLSYQHSHCFNFDHRNCVVLVAEAPVDLPPDIAANPVKRRAAIVVGGIASLFVVVIAFMILFGGWQSAGAIDQGPDAGQAPTAILDNSDILPGSLTPTTEQVVSSEATPTIMEMTATNVQLPSSTVPENTVAAPEIKPPTATKNPPTALPTTCGVPPGWEIYIVQVGDTLSSIAAAQGVSVQQLQNANCLTSAAVYIGQRLYVPHAVNANPIPPTKTATNAPTATRALPDTAVPTNTQVPTATEIPPQPTETDLPLPSDTPIPMPTSPPLPTATPTPISLPVTPNP